MPAEIDPFAAFIEFADTMIAEYDIVEFLHRLAKRCVELVDVSEAGIMLVDHNGMLRYVASSSERMRLIELFELQHEQGPCVDAYRRGVPICVALTDDAQTRWPRFVPEAREVGFLSVAALPMRLRSEVIGALNLFSSDPIPLGMGDQRLAQALADIATIGILQQRALSDAQNGATQLEAALESRVVIEQAKGIIAEHEDVDVDVAFAQIRDYARNHNRRLGEVAREVVDGVLAIGQLPTARTEPLP
jgi:GAF domain-containing protein